MKTNKRVLAWLVALCMIVAIIPAMPAEYASAAGNVLKYDFTGMVTADTFLTDPATKVGIDGLAETYGYSYPKKSGEEWGFISIAKNNASHGAEYVHLKTDCIRLYANKTHRWVQINLKIKVPTSGYYVPYLNSLFRNYTGTLYKLRVGMYELKANGSFDTDKKFFANESVTGSIEGLGVKVNDAIYLEGGKEYGVQMHMTGGAPTSGNALIDLYNFSLAEVVEEIVPSADVPTLLSIGESASSSFVAKFGDDDLGAQFSAVSSDDSVVSVSESNGTYTFKGLKEGFSTVTVTATYGDGKTLEKVYNIAVRNEPTAFTYYFSGMVNESVMTFSESNTGKSGDKIPSSITYESTDASNSYPWKIYGTYRSGVSSTPEARNVFVRPDCIEIANDGGSTSNVQIGIKVPVSGYYTVTTNATFEDANSNGKLSIYAEKAASVGGGLISNPIAYTNQGAMKDVFNVEKVYLEAYDENAETPISNYRFYLESNKKGAKIYSITLTPWVEPKEEIGANFGNTYAFIREVNDGRNTTYKLVLVGAIDSLNYEEVGFKAYNEDICAMLGVDVIKLGTKQVYNKISVGGNEFTAEDFGLNSGYIFTAEYDVPSVAAAMSVDFWAYATTADDEIEGGKRVIPSLAK